MFSLQTELRTMSYSEMSIVLLLVSLQLIHSTSSLAYGLHDEGQHEPLKPLDFKEPNNKNQGLKGQDSVFAFTAELSNNQEISPGLPIIFDVSPVNEGERYYNTSGQFFCTDDAIYVFVWSLQRTGGVHGVSTLRLGGEGLLDGPQTSYYSNEFFSGSTQMSAVIQCRTNPFSAVTVASALSNDPTPVFGSHFTSFSGFRLGELDQVVGFTAQLSRDTFVYPGGRVIFDDVLCDFSDHYENLHGYFRCPDNGIYGFTVSTHFPNPLTAPIQWSVSRIVFNGKTFLQGPMTYGATDENESGTATVQALLQCELGKDVYIESQAAFDFESSKYGAGLTSFTGFGLCHDNCSDYVAFTAVLSFNDTISDSPLVLDNVLTNVGSAYDPSNGRFRCPDDLLYMFSWSATSSSGSCSVDLYIDSTFVKGNYMNYRTGSTGMLGTSGTASMSTIVRCSTGSIVTLRGMGLSTSRFLLADFTTFSGFRIPGQ